MGFKRPRDLGIPCVASCSQPTSFIINMLSFQEVMKYNESSNKDELVEGILWRNYNG